MDTDTTTTDTGGKRRRVQAGALTAGAVVALFLAGLGVAGAQTDDSPPAGDPPAGQSQPAPDEGRRPGKHGRPGHHGHHVKAGLDVAANTIGVSHEELVTALRNGRSIAQVAQSRNVDPQKVIDAMVADAKEHLADAVRSGRLTQAEADEKAAAVTERVTAVVNREGLPERRRGGHGHGPKAGLDTAAEAIGIPREELVTALRNGQSIAQVAQSRNVDPQKVIDAMVADAKERLAEAVESGRLTQAQADEKAAALTERITEAVNREGRRGPARRPGPRPSGGDAPAERSSATLA
jgi:urease accessory protein UreF